MMATITIDDRRLEFQPPMTILAAARRLGIAIPTLCFNEHLTPYGGCRVCLVEVAGAGRGRLLPACATPAEDGMNVVTASERVREARQFVIELLLSRAPQSPELQAIARSLGVDPAGALDEVAAYLLVRAPRREPTHCILCALCVRVCAQVPERHALSLSKRGIQRRAISPFGKVAETCIGCGSCAYVCPTKTVKVEEAG
jgi:NADH dehydrogenase/NADH:ubiquinone oxidoreductase subunit G